MDPTDAMDVLGASPGGGLHPLIPTSSLRPNEVSVDTGKGSWGPKTQLLVSGGLSLATDGAGGLIVLKPCTASPAQQAWTTSATDLMRTWAWRECSVGGGRGVGGEGGRAAGGPRERRPGWEGHGHRSAALALHSTARTALLLLGIQVAHTDSY